MASIGTNRQYVTLERRHGGGGLSRQGSGQQKAPA